MYTFGVMQDHLRGQVVVSKVTLVKGEESRVGGLGQIDHQTRVDLAVGYLEGVLQVNVERTALLEVLQVGHIVLHANTQDPIGSYSNICHILPTKLHLRIERGRGPADASGLGACRKCGGRATVPRRHWRPRRTSVGWQTGSVPRH